MTSEAHKCSPLTCRGGMVLYLRVETGERPIFVAYCRDHLERASAYVLALWDQVQESKGTHES